MDEVEVATRKQRYNEAFAAADLAAAKADAAGLVEALLQPHIAAGLAYRVKKYLAAKKMYAVEQDDVELAVAEAIRAVYDLVIAGHPPKKVGGYLFMACRNKAFAIYTVRRGKSVADAAVIEGVVGVEDAGQDLDLESDLSSLEDKQAAYLRHIREKIIPQLGKENIQKVMDYIFQAVENGLTAETSEIATALGVSESHVRSWKSRGFERLKARLEAGGLLDPQRRGELAELGGEDDAGDVDNEDAVA